MVEPIDIWRSTHVLVEECRFATNGHAMRRGIDTHELNDVAGHSIWRRNYGVIIMCRETTSPREQIR
ncbi:hypothetical protein [Acidibrevibacterium fodinaquatile]|uniref:hypothetical protein n=1 Tax=Acidibrevibacterium fodinaquatile TaxID=1969806 RepID=UPI0013B3E01B|nr:hypothetical protein [Acidibrevibacterium fodinaquatile]